VGLVAAQLDTSRSLRQCPAGGFLVFLVSDNARFIAGEDSHVLTPAERAQLGNDSTQSNKLLPFIALLYQLCCF
jgi:hypothetical protein